MTIAEMHEVSKIFIDSRNGKGLVAIRDMSLTIKEGEFLCLIGPSGCGKSTSLNLLAGFETPSRGKVLFRGEPVKGPSPQRGVVFQEPSLFPWMSVLQNVMFSIQSKDKGERKRIALENLRIVSLDGFAHYRPNELSGGMKQRVAIARTLAMNPEMLLMDEPFSNLDEQTRRKMDEEVLKIWKREERTVVFVTHNIEEALMLGTRIVLMSASPGKKEREWVIDLPWPRDPTSDYLMDKKVEMARKMSACHCANSSNDLLEVTD
ncbi:MAG: sulfonate transport system ATP-binding protein [Candidatus Methanomethylophilaceae archaeon]|nr:sulfonate transport system ATP-binding protein [Candidatus Methanomethylophilaceae archaeon]MDI3541178.1 sulfonate transport system ATP-binding protein [Candidatus Methanomethylophilaceae archaeon]HIJ00834.1 ABC transporter ATP-binding protein [Candidatus Methanomethylophilaceae archaeon]